MTVGVLIAADKPVVRRAVRLALEAEGCHVVAECPAGRAVVEMAASCHADVVVLGWPTSGDSPVDDLRRLCETVPDARIVVTSTRPAVEEARLVLRAGADRYVDTNDLSGLVSAVTRSSPVGSARAGQGTLATDPHGPEHEGETRPLRVLVVDDDVTARRLLRLGLELGGAAVSEAASLAQARRLLVDHVDGVVLDRRLSDGDGLELLPLLAERHPEANVVVCSNMDDHAEPWFVAHVPKTDMDGVVSALGLSRRQPPSLFTDVRFGTSLPEIVARWSTRLGRELSAPPVAAVHAFVGQVVHALAVPEAPAPATGNGVVGPQDAEVTVRQLVDLREMVTAEIGRQLDSAESGAVLAAVNRELDIWILGVVGRDVERLRRQASTDALTGLLNRRAFDEALSQEVARASRYRRPFSVAMVDLDGLKLINDRDGHPAGDAALVAMATAIRRSLRLSDRAYRVGGDEFVILLPETPKRLVQGIIDRFSSEGAPAFSWGAATYLEDTDDSDTVIDLADRQLLARRRATRA
ncbi:MAG TPA: diguanylate cyclase [Acidimicrobiales bacterium]|nr:diguanylate cyclase [Acidimicrobiales bacterium]